ncbi:hypothetical protein KC323_g229 [Hortaea werneckii]|nr:hypothetical protein KC323_g229 [Hortaea werneckii]
MIWNIGLAKFCAADPDETVRRCFETRRVPMRHFSILHIAKPRFAQLTPVNCVPIYARDSSKPTASNEPIVGVGFIASRSQARRFGTKSRQAVTCGGDCEGDDDNQPPRPGCKRVHCKTSLRVCTGPGYLQQRVEMSSRRIDTVYAEGLLTMSALVCLPWVSQCTTGKDALE